MAHDIARAILEGRTFLGIELGSTRIKAVLIDQTFHPVASGAHDWENRLENGVWTYPLDDVWAGLRESYARLCGDVNARYGVRLTTTGGIGISAMMHGYLAFDRSGGQLAPFRTWRNTMTKQAAETLTQTFGFSIPQRWSVAHLYQAILNGESHVRDIAHLTTLAGYVHWKLTGQTVLGLGDASGMFPLDVAMSAYDPRMADAFGALTAGAHLGWHITELLPRILKAGEHAGTLTEQGAKLLDPTGALQAGIPLCPPEGDAGTGLVATNSVSERTGSVSAGTSVFAMAVLEKPLSKLYPEIDIAVTPSGKPVAMVHCNNCTSDLDAWFGVLRQANELMGNRVEKPALYDALYHKALEGDADCGGLLAYNYLSGEHLTGFEHGRPLFTRLPGSRFTLANFARALLFSAMGTLRFGMDILTEKEHVRLDRLLGHGGLFKTKGAGQKLMAAALNVPVTVMETAGEGGAWGAALLAAYSARRDQAETLEAFLAQKVFAGQTGVSAEPDPKDAAGFAAFMKRYAAGLAIERAAVEYLKS